MKQCIKTALALCCLMAMGAAQAAEPVSAAKKELVQKVLTLSQPWAEGFARTVVVEQPLAQMGPAVNASLQNMPADKREAAGKAIDADVKKYVDEVTPISRKKAQELAPKTLAPLFEEKFSEDELKTLVAWLESPVSRKFGQVQPEMQQAMGQALVADTRTVIEPKLKALQQTIGQRLGMAPQTPPPAAAASKAPAKK
jgi:hypothetical protein